MTSLISLSSPSGAAVSHFPRLPVCHHFVEFSEDGGADNDRRSRRQAETVLVLRSLSAMRKGAQFYKLGEFWVTVACPTIYNLEILGYCSFLSTDFYKLRRFGVTLEVLLSVFYYNSDNKNGSLHISSSQIVVVEPGHTSIDQL